MSGIVDFASKLLAANTTYTDAVEGVREAPPGTYQLFCQLPGAPRGQATQVGYVDPLSPLKRYSPGDSREYAQMRAYAATYSVKQIEKSTEIARTDLELDPSGRVAAGLAAWVNENAVLADEDIWSELLANRVGLDGVALLSDSHPYGPAGATQDNLTTAALSFTSYNAAIAAMRGYKRENGVPLRINPTHLFVPPALERTALEVAGADRPVPFSASAQDATSSIVAATSITNVYQGRTQVVVVEWMDDSDEWLLMDLSKTAKPFYAELSPVMDFTPDAQDETLRDRDMLRYSMRMDVIRGPATWQLIYGRLDS
jgi:phage major head subunit gpT-like protein